MRRVEILFDHGRFRIPIFHHISSSWIWVGTVIRLSARRMGGWKRSSSVSRVRLRAASAWTEVQFCIGSNIVQNDGADRSGQSSRGRLLKAIPASQSDL